MHKLTIIYGTAGSGKSRKATEIAKQYGVDAVEVTTITALKNRGRLVADHIQCVVVDSFPLDGYISSLTKPLVCHWAKCKVEHVIALIQTPSSYRFKPQSGVEFIHVEIKKQPAPC